MVLKNSSKILNLTSYFFTDPQVENETDRHLVETMLNKFSTKPSTQTNLKRAFAVADFVKQRGYLMVVIDCPSFMVLTLNNVFMNEGLFLMFPLAGENGEHMLLDINGNVITRGGK